MCLVIIRRARARLLKCCFAGWRGQTREVGRVEGIRWRAGIDRRAEVPVEYIILGFRSIYFVYYIMAKNSDSSFHSLSESHAW